MRHHLLAALLLASLLGVAGQALAAAQQAGKIIMSIGTVSVLRDGKESPAPRNMIVLSGDTLRTGASSNAQLKLDDGAIVALRPNTDFQVKEYNYQGKSDGSEKASLSLLKGGVRAVTGAIGKTNRDNFKVDAVVATIGIRGTGFNLVLCDGACRQSDPSAKDGLYAGVFEGRIVVSNESSAPLELGVNQFAHVSAIKAEPVRVITPPAFMRDNLEGQSQAKSKTLKAEGVSEGDAANVVEKAPIERSLDALTAVSNNKIDQVNLAPSSQAAPAPTKFYDVAGSGDGKALDATPVTGKWSFQSAEYNTLTGADRRSDNDIKEGAGRALTFVQSDGQLQVVKQNSVEAYAIKNAYQKEGGSDAGVIAWGRWAGGSPHIGDYGGAVPLTEAQGFHYIAGARTTALSAGLEGKTFTFNIIGATTPTQAAAGAQGGWRVYGGSLTANLATTNVSLSGLLNLYLNQGGAAGNYDMTFSGNSNSIQGAAVAGSVIRTQGNTTVCVASCGASGNVGFYGTDASHAGMTYEFNTGSNYVQGSAVFKR